MQRALDNGGVGRAVDAERKRKYPRQSVRQWLIAAAAAVTCAGAVQARASTILLTGGSPSDGLHIQGATVETAVYFNTSAPGTTTYTLQGVTFYPFRSEAGDGYPASVTYGNGTDYASANEAAGFSDQSDTADDAALSAITQVTFNNTVVATISGLTNNTTYQLNFLICLGNSNAARQEGVEINGGSEEYIPSSSGTLTESSEGASPATYVYDVSDTAVANGSGDIMFQFVPNSCLVNALVVTAVPEPATMGLLGIASIGMLCRRRRNRVDNAELK